MSWWRVAIAIGVPTVAGLIIAVPLWLRRQVIIGNVLGGGVAFGIIIALMGRDFVERMRLDKLCGTPGFRCVSGVDAHVPFLMHALIGMADVGIVFVISLYVEERVRNATLRRDWS
jgi:hypothetical protein